MHINFGVHVSVAKPCKQFETGTLLVLITNRKSHSSLLSLSLSITIDVLEGKLLSEIHFFCFLYTVGWVF